MLYKLMKFGNIPKITDSKAAFEEAKYDEAYQAEEIDTNLPLTLYLGLRKDSQELTTSFHKLHELCETLEYIVEKHPTDTEFDAEILQAVEESMSSMKTLRSIVDKLLGKKIE